jgi:hypothetical protein
VGKKSGEEICLFVRDEQTGRFLFNAEALQALGINPVAARQRGYPMRSNLLWLKRRETRAPFHRVPPWTEGIGQRRKLDVAYSCSSIRSTRLTFVQSWTIFVPNGLPASSVIWVLEFCRVAQHPRPLAARPVIWIGRAKDHGGKRFWLSDRPVPSQM